MIVTTVSSIITEDEASKENIRIEEIATTHNPVRRRKFRPNAYYESGGNYEAAFVVPQAPKSVSKKPLSITESVTPELRNETTPRVLTLEETIHPIVNEFVKRVRRVKDFLSTANRTSTSTAHPVETSFNPRDPNNPKLKYYQDFYRKVLNDTVDNTNSTQDHRDSSFIRAYYAQKNFPTPIDYSKEDDSLVKTLGGTKTLEKSKRLPFNTKDFYSPKYRQMSQFHYDFFPRYNGSKVYVPIHV